MYVGTRMRFSCSLFPLVSGPRDILHVSRQSSAGGPHTHRPSLSQVKLEANGTSYHCSAIALVCTIYCLSLYVR